MPRIYDAPQEPAAPDCPISYDRIDYRYSATQGVWWAGIHRTAKGDLVRSKSEVIVADTLTRLGISIGTRSRCTRRTTRATSASRTIR